MPSRNGAATAVVLAGGDPVDAGLRSLLPEHTTVIAADSGLHQAAELDLTVDLVVGDLDSVDIPTLERAVTGGTTVVRHPTAKDETDLELAVRAAADRGAERIIVVGGAGGRLDHLVANLLLLTSPAFAHLDIEALVGTARVTPVRGTTELVGAKGDLVTLLAVGGPARGVRTTGLVYPLDGEDLHPGSTRGVSNELAAPLATVSLAAGTLLAIQPYGGRS